MALSDEEYSLNWHNHSQNFVSSFNELLDQKELIDVTLVGDGCCFGAHRFVLSALSPCFRQMFTQIPANQQAFGKNKNLFHFKSIRLNFFLFVFSIFKRYVQPNNRTFN